MYVCIACSLITNELPNCFGWGPHRQLKCFFNSSFNTQNILHFGRGLSSNEKMTVGSLATPCLQVILKRSCIQNTSHFMFRHHISFEILDM
jgi:hypothetical protein